ncbi:hypothetical protein [Formosa algae]|uniref:DUF3575 domain-containing protein n=1 Tax=Formosa algae TaxID=225843 RepID=A0A9X1C915_9FLAO|nr:hypothetical protein [Formosa algae]MBP1840286.1 hypothetical protein [Formosa algae]MDQ0334150.1 hypothetical protein [Formosa algae]OEI79475.1 hypothetical protein AST99_14780 [Formosa algae]PNW29495.1 hypothetical protein BKP44_03985 [Formosa algae]
MKNIVLAVTLFSVSHFVQAQTATVESSLFNIQTGFLGIYINNEARLTSSIILRSEIGLDAGIWENDFYDTSGFLLTPVLTAEPRWYYNLKKRANKNKRIDHNSGNFISIKTSYHPDWFTISNQNNINVISDLTIIPTWGIRRNIGTRFNYETGIGIGYGRYLISTDDYYYGDRDVVAVNLHLRMGYLF